MAVFRFDDDTRLRKLKSICKPNFNEISEPMAKYVFPVRKRTAAILKFYFQIKY